MRILTGLICSMLCLVQTLAGQSQANTLLDSGSVGRDLPYLIRGWEVSVFEDVSNGMSIEKLSHLPDSLFKPLHHECCNFGAERNTLWLRIRLQNQTEKERFYLELVNPFITKVTFYQLDTVGNLVRTDTTGTAYPFDQRPVKHRNFIFPFSVKKNATTWVYLALEPDYPLNLRMLLWEADRRFGTQQRAEDVMLTVFFVFCTIYLALSTVLILLSKQYYLWPYYVYVLLTTAFIPAHLGLGFRYVWPVAPYLQFAVPATLNCLRLMFGIWFFRKYFDIPAKSKRLDTFLKVSMSLFVLTAVFIIFHKWISLRIMGWALNMFFGYLIIFSLVVTGWTLQQIFSKKRRTTTWFLLIAAIHVFVQGSTALQYLGYGVYDPVARLLPFGDRTLTFFVQTTLMAGFFIEVLVVFYFATVRFHRLIAHNQLMLTRLAQVREEGLNNMIIGVENERKRIASDLHDGACVNIAAVKMKMESLREHFPENDLREKITEMTEDLDHTYKEVRDISHNLMSKALEKTDLQTALEELLVRVRQAQPGIQTQLYCNIDPGEINDMAKIQIYRIIQELTTNVLKHADAKNLDVQLLLLEGKLLLTVEDDGKGFETGQTGNGIGLSNVRLRAGLLQGICKIASAPGRGTFVSIEMSEKIILPKGPIS